MRRRVKYVGVASLTSEGLLGGDSLRKLGNFSEPVLLLVNPSLGGENLVDGLRCWVVNSRGKRGLPDAYPIFVNHLNEELALLICHR